jgi:hypothetical protein
VEPDYATLAFAGTVAQYDLDREKLDALMSLEEVSVV